MIAHLAEFSASLCLKAPPDTGLHTIFSTYHSLAHIMKFIGHTVVPIIFHLCEKGSIIVKTACQLMGIAPLHIRFHIIIPSGCLVVIQGVTPDDGDISKGGIVRLQFLCYCLQICDATLPPTIVGFIEW